MRFSEVNRLRQLLLALLLCWYLPTQAQRVTDPVLKSLVKNTLNAYQKKPLEKLYVQTDKPTYLRGDTLRLKAYLLNGDYRSASALSGILYVELNNEDGRDIKRMMLPVSNGLAWVDMPLDTADVKQGNYTLRAYTNWMRNFGEDYIFKKDITISGHKGNPILASSSFKQTRSQVETALQFRTLSGRLVSFKDVELKLMSGKKNVSKDKFITDPNGMVKFNFEMPEGNEPLSIKAMIKGGAELTIPVSLPRHENIDVHFMPEGGALVAGIIGKVGIKAIGEDGKGVNVSGKLYNSKGEEVGIINTTYKGMGNFEFTPQAGESYSAKINSKSYKLPTINLAGTSLSIKTSTADSIIVHIESTKSSGGRYYLIGQSRGVVCYAEPVSLSGVPVFKSVSKNLFPTGIARFTLLNSAQQPVNDRIVFINHRDELTFNIQSHKNNYTTRDSIALSILVTDKDGKPVQGNFSVAVTDNSQVKIDSLSGDILTNLLLTSDLKGEIEQPGAYFTANKEAELDNLMLTQGWVGYDWKEILSPETKPMAYQPEKEYVVSGTVTNAFGKPIEKSPIVLMGNKPVVALDTLTNKEGRFTFRDVWPVDTAIFKLQARNKRNKDFNVSITMDEQTFPEFKAGQFIPAPWYVNTDTTLLNNATSTVAEETAKMKYRGEGMQLKEVNIKAQKVVKGSKNLNPTRIPDLVLDEEDMLIARKKTLLKLLREKVPAIMDFAYVNNELESWVLHQYAMKICIDGIDVMRYFRPIDPSNSVYERWLWIKNYLDYFTAEDVVGIELKFTYIEITTRTGHGPSMHVTPGTYLYKPLAFTMPKQFYSPKYTVKNKTIALGTDMRSTIFWEPNIVTDAAGKATVSFYSADKTADYSVIVEGTDMSGGLGFGKKEIKLK